MAVRTLEDLLADGVEGRGVLVRSDLNVPLDGGAITDPGRIVASAPTIAKLVEAGAKVIITAHLGRPKGGPIRRCPWRLLRHACRKSWVATSSSPATSWARMRWRAPRSHRR